MRFEETCLRLAGRLLKSTGDGRGYATGVSDDTGIDLNPVGITARGSCYPLLCERQPCKSNSRDNPRSVKIMCYKNRVFLFVFFLKKGPGFSFILRKHACLWYASIRNGTLLLRGYVHAAG